MHQRRDTLTAADRQRVAEVFTTHRQFLENVARRHAPSPDHVPDIVQTVAMRVCTGLNGFRDESALTTWLYRVTVNTARTYYEGERRHQRAVEAVQTYPTPDQVVQPDEGLLAADRAAALEAGIDQLKPFYQQLMRNHLTESLVELGSKTSRHRARRQLRQLLADDPRLDTDE